MSSSDGFRKVHEKQFRKASGRRRRSAREKRWDEALLAVRRFRFDTKKRSNKKKHGAGMANSTARNRININILHEKIFQFEWKCFQSSRLLFCFIPRSGVSSCLCFNLDSLFTSNFQHPARPFLFVTVGWLRKYRRCWWHEVENKKGFRRFHRISPQHCTYSSLLCSETETLMLKSLCMCIIN